MERAAHTGKSTGQAAQIPDQPAERFVGLRRLLGLSKNRTEDLTPQTQMGIALAATKRQGETYAGTVSYAERQRRRAASRRAKASRRNNRRSR